MFQKPRGPSNPGQLGDDSILSLWWPGIVDSIHVSIASMIGVVLAAGSAGTRIAQRDILYAAMWQIVSRYAKHEYDYKCMYGI